MINLHKILGQNILTLIAGLSDGILTALTLAAGRVVEMAAAPMSIGLALRVAFAGASSGAFMFAVSQYAQLRFELLRAEKQLNLTVHGRLASSRLGKAVLIESLIAAAIGSIAGFCGSMLPLSIGVLFPDFRFLAIIAALMALAILGVFLAITVNGGVIRWGVSLIMAGVAFTYLGIRLKLI